MEFIDNIKIGKKLIASFLIVALIIVLVALVGYQGMLSTGKDLTSMYTDRLLPVDQLGSAGLFVWEIRGSTYRYADIASDREATKKSINDAISGFEKNISEYASSYMEPDEKAEYEKLNKNWAEYKSHIPVFLNLVDENKKEEIFSDLSSGKLVTTRKAVSDQLKVLLEINTNKAKELNIRADSTFASSMFMILLFTLLGIIAAITLGVVISRSISIPMGKAVEMIGEMSKGHLSMRLGFDRKDEIGTMSSAMDSFSNELQNVVIAGMNQIASGDLSLKVTPKDDQDEISPAMVTMISTLTHLVHEADRLSQAAVAGELKTRGDATPFKGGYRQIVEGVNATLDAVIIPVNEAMRLSGSYSRGDYSDRISEQIIVKGDFIAFKEALNMIGIQGSQAIGGVKSEIENLTGGMEETNASAEEVASSTGLLSQSASTVSNLAERSGAGVSQILNAMEDLSETVSAVATKAEQASALAKQSVDLSERGVDLAGKAETGMEGIMQSVEETSGIITDITGQMEEIGKIVDVITGIAEQTGLLALNAAIEAARAGDAGMGFAVVADEVKSLALESQKSAENIASIIGNLQKKSRLVSESMKSSATEVKEGNSAVSETLQVFTQIVEAINKVNANMTEVAGATEEQAASVEEITASVHEVASLVNDTSREAVSSAAATEEITAAIDQVTRAITDASASIQRISMDMNQFKVV